MRLLLLVEGQSDRYALPILVRKLIGGGIGVDALPLGKGDLLSPQRLVVHIRYTVARQADIGRVLLCIDSECTPIDETRARLDTVVRQLEGSFQNLPVKAVVVDHSLEGWFLQDRPALAQYLGVLPTRLRYGDPEAECRPADLMRRVFRRARKKGFSKTGDLPSLAELIDPQQLAEFSPTFRDLRQAVMGG